MYQERELVPLLPPGAQARGAGQRTWLTAASKASLRPGCFCLLQDAQPGAQLLPVAATHLCLVAAVLGRAPKDEGV